MNNLINFTKLIRLYILRILYHECEHIFMDTVITIRISMGGIQMSIYDFTVFTNTNEEIPISNYQDKVMLIVNTASKCGLTPQFQGLQELYDEYQEGDFVVLGFPCGQFANQEFADGEEAASFCQKNYGVTFPMFAKVDVNGINAHPLFAYLTKAKKGFLGTKKIKWNFNKFLVDRSGKVVKRYPPTTKPEKIADDIEKLL